MDGRQKLDFDGGDDCVERVLCAGHARCGDDAGGALAALLLVYLTVALARPEKF